MRVAYFDLANGISGDMALGALAHAGRRIGAAVEKSMSDAVASLGLDCSLEVVDAKRGPVACLQAVVTTTDARYSPQQLRDAIGRADAPDAARARAIDALDALVAAEATVHGTSPEDVHLHELASSDTAADLLGAAVGLAALAVESVCAAPVPVPSGWMTSGHGALPLPAPVTLELLTGTALRGVDSDRELVTPSGAAILRAHGAVHGLLPELTLEAVGIGAGSRDTDRPNICRVLIGRAAARPAGTRTQTCVLLETNIDDQTPEQVAHALELLLARGALDAWITPIVMKRSRPAFLLSVLTEPDDEQRIGEEVFRNTTTLGVRRRTVTRHVLDREHLTVAVQGHEVRVKVARLGGRVVNVAPEFADCVTAAEALGLAVKDVYAQATSAARAELA